MKTIKLTKLSKIIIFVFALVLAGVAVWKFDLLNSAKQAVDEATTNTVTEKTTKSEKSTTTTSDNNTIRLSLDEWIGWASIVQAEEKGLYDEAGINVELSIINDATQSSNAIISNELDGGGYTVNRVAFLTDKFEQADTSIVMPFITNYSNGGDGIVATNDITSVNDLVGKKVAIPRFSEAQTLVEWLLLKSDLTEDEISKIEFVYTDTPDESAKLFFSNKVDAAATWQPYLSQAEEMGNAHVLFDTSSATNLILDGIVFRKDFYEENTELVNKFIQVTLDSTGLYGQELDAIRNTMPLFALESDESILAMESDAQLATYQDNISLYNSEVQKMFTDMSDVWTNVFEKSTDKSYGEFNNRSDLVDEIFITEPLTSLSSNFQNEVVETKTATFTQEQKNNAKNLDSLLSKSATINFQPNSAVFLDQAEAEKTLKEFIDIANSLNGTIIQVEGNIADTGSGDDESGRKLSEQRAKTVVNYMVQNGVDASRFIVIGNGTTKPVAPNDTEANMAKNRRTDISFKIVE